MEMHFKLKANPYVLISIQLTSKNMLVNQTPCFLTHLMYL